MGWRVSRGWAAIAPLLIGSMMACGATPGATNAANPSASIAVEPSAAPAIEAPQICTPSPARANLPKSLGANTISSTVAIAEWGDHSVAFVADEDVRAVLVVDLDANKLLSATPLAATPSQLLLLSDGRVVVTLRDRSKLAVLETGEIGAPLSARCEVDTPAEPVAMAMSPDGNALLVAAVSAQKLAVYDAAAVKLRFSVDTLRAPQAVAVSSDGKLAFVVHSVGGRASIVDLDKKSVRSVSLDGRRDYEIDQLRKKLLEKLKPTGGPLSKAQREQLIEELEELEKERAKRKHSYGQRRASQTFALAQSTGLSQRLLAPQVLVETGDKNRRMPGYGERHNRGAMFNIAVLDEASAYPMSGSLRIGRNTNRYVRYDEAPPQPCLLPRAAAFDAKSQSVLVSCFGIDALIAYDAFNSDPAHAEKRRWRVAAGPSGIAVDPFDHRAIVWSQFDRTLNIVALGGEELEMQDGQLQRQVRRIPLDSLSERAPSLARRLGRALFYGTGDSRVASDGRACASCHPDGRDDGLVWATPDGPRRTIMLAGRLNKTAPYSWSGRSRRLEDHLNLEFKRLQGVGLRGVQRSALLSYIKALPPPPSVSPGDDESTVARGREIFASKRAGCAGCHKGAQLTDNRRHDVGSKTRADRINSFNTPSLKFLAQRGPYFHDGRFATLEELLEKTDGKMGNTGHLGKEDLEALEAYLKSL